MNTAKEFLLDVPVPARTDSYTPVSHANIIEATYEQLDKHNLVATNEFFNSSSDGRKVLGGLDIIHPDTPNLGMRLAFRNSYDKSMSVAFVAGANVWIWNKSPCIVIYIENPVNCWKLLLLRSEWGQSAAELLII